MTPNKDWLSLANNAYSTSTTWFDASIRMQAERDIRQFQSAHPRDSKYLTDTYRARSKVFRPKTRSAIRSSEAQAAAAFFSTEDVVNVSALDDNDPMHKASAELQKALLQYRLTHSVPWYQFLIGGYQEAQALGVVQAYFEWDAENDRPRAELIPIENLRIDPAADWMDPVGSSPYIIQLLPMYAQDVIERTRRDRLPWKPVTAEQLRQSTRTTDSIRQQREGNRTDSKDQGGVTDFTVVWVHRVVVRSGGQDWMFYTLGEQALLSDPVPLQQAYWHGRRPYVIGTCFLEAHRLYPTSKPALTRETQAEINEIANQRIDNVKFAMNKRYFVRRNQQVDVRSLVRNVPSSVTLMNDPDKDVKVVDTPDVTGSSYQEQDRLNLDFDDVAGVFSGSSVQSNRALNETVGGMQLLSGGSNQMGEYELRTFAETFVEPAIKQIIALEQHYESDEAVLMIAGERAALAREFGLTEITEDLLMHEVVTRVNVGVGSTNTFNALERFGLALRMVREAFGDAAMQRLQFDEVVAEIFGKSGYKDGRRFFIQEGDDPVVDGLMQQIGQLQAALEAKHPPELIAAQVAKLREDVELARAKRVQTGVQAAYAAIQAGGAVAANPQLAPVADAVMMASGYRAPNPMGDDPNFPQPQGVPAAPPMGTNTSPAFPAQPASAMAGIETPEVA